MNFLTFKMYMLDDPWTLGFTLSYRIFI